MAQNNLPESYKGTALDPYSNLAEQRRQEGLPSRIMLSVTESGYRVDKNGLPYEYLKGYALNDNPLFRDESTGELSVVLVRLKTAKATAEEMKSFESSNYNPGEQKNLESHFASSYRQHRKKTFSQVLGKNGANPRGGAVMVVDFPKIEDQKIIPGRENGPRVIELSANYAGVMLNRSSKEDFEDRILKADIKMGRVGFNRTESGNRDTVFVETLDEGITERILPTSSPDFKAQQKRLARFMSEALSNKEPNARPEFAETASRDGFLMLKLNVISEDEQLVTKLRDISDSLTKIYPSREELSDAASSFDPITGEQRKILIASENRVTLTKLATGKDKATLDYLGNPSNPELERRAREADVQRAFLHAISARPSRGKTEEDRTLVVAVNDPEHRENVKLLHEATIQGNLEVTAVKGTKVSFIQDFRDKKAMVLRQVYDEVYSGNPSKVAATTQIKPHSTDKSVIQVEEFTDEHGNVRKRPVDIYYDINVMSAEITRNSASNGSLVGTRFSTGHPINIKMGNWFKNNIDINLINKNVSYGVGQGIDGYRISPDAAKIAKDYFPLKRTVEDAVKAHLQSKNTAEVAPNTALPARDLNGNVITNDDAKRIGEGLQAFLNDGLGLGNEAPDFDQVMNERNQVSEDLNSYANMLVEQIKSARSGGQLEASQPEPAQPTPPAQPKPTQSEPTAERTPKRNKPR